MFPGPNAQIYHNEAGEVIGWDYPPDPDSFYCDRCGGNHTGSCPPEDYEDEEEDDSV